jgi:hypothetical protein
MTKRMAQGTPAIVSPAYPLHLRGRPQRCRFGRTIRFPLRPKESPEHRGLLGPDAMIGWRYNKIHLNPSVVSRSLRDSKTSPQTFNNVFNTPMPSVL